MKNKLTYLMVTYKTVVLLVVKSCWHNQPHKPAPWLSISNVQRVWSWELQAQQPSEGLRQPNENVICWRALPAAKQIMAPPKNLLQNPTTSSGATQSKIQEPTEHAYCLEYKVGALPQLLLSIHMPGPPLKPNGPQYCMRGFHWWTLTGTTKERAPGK